MNLHARLLAAASLALVMLAAQADLVTVESGGEQFSAVFTQAVQASSTQRSRPVPAAVLVHSAGGYLDGTTGPLAKALNSAGISTLELQFFDRLSLRRPSFETMTQATFAALRWLAARPDTDAQRIGMAGFSMGAYLAIWTASESLATAFGGRRFAAHAAIYPVCWQQTIWAKGEKAPKFPALSFPSDFLKRFTGAPVALFAAGKDDYDDRDPAACKEFVGAVDEKYRGAFQALATLRRRMAGTSAANRSSRKWPVRGVAA
jgi:dienelactone hydrolase